MPRYGDGAAKRSRHTRAGNGRLDASMNVGAYFQRVTYDERSISIQYAIVMILWTDKTWRYRYLCSGDKIGSRDKRTGGRDVRQGRGKSLNAKLGMKTRLRRWIEGEYSYYYLPMTWWWVSTKGANRRNKGRISSVSVFYNNKGRKVARSRRGSGIDAENTKEMEVKKENVGSV